MATDPRDVTAAFSAAVHRHVLTHGCERAHDKLACFAPVLLILRRSAKHGEGMNFAAFADLRAARDYGVRMDLDGFSERYVTPYNRKSADLDPFSDLRFVVYCRCRMN